MLPRSPVQTVGSFSPTHLFACCPVDVVFVMGCGCACCPCGHADEMLMMYEVSPYSSYSPIIQILIWHCMCFKLRACTWAHCKMPTTSWPFLQLRTAGARGSFHACSYFYLHTCIAGPRQADKISPHLMNYGQKESLLHHIGWVEMAKANDLSCCVPMHAAIQPRWFACMWPICTTSQSFWCMLGAPAQLLAGKW